MKSKTEDKINSKILNAALLIFVIIIFLVFFEIFLRAGFPKGDYIKLFCDDDAYGWRFCRNAEARIISRGNYDSYIKINSNGLRDFENAGKPRSIAFFGDSLVANLGISNPKLVFTEILEENLQGYNVLNFGVDGYGTGQEYLLLDEALRLNPDIVLFFFSIATDFHDNAGLLNWVYDYRRPVLGPDLKVMGGNSVAQKNSIKRLLLKSMVIEFFNSKANNINFLRKILESAGIKKKASDEQLRSIFVPPEVQLNNLSEPNISYAYNLSCTVLSAANDKVKSRSAEFYLIIVPNIAQVRNELFEELQKKYGIEDRFFPTKQLIECAEKNNISYIDLAPAMTAIENEHNERFLYFPNDPHWSIEGNKAVAKIIYNSIINASSTNISAKAYK